jgi:hypothetical protein
VPGISDNGNFTSFLTSKMKSGNHLKNGADSEKLYEQEEIKNFCVYNCVLNEKRTSETIFQNP